MSDENARYAALIAADIEVLYAQIANRRALVDAETAELEADERRAADLKALYQHVKGAES